MGNFLMLLGALAVAVFLLKFWEAGSVTISFGRREEDSGRRPLPRSRGRRCELSEARRPDPKLLGDGHAEDEDG